MAKKLKKKIRKFPKFKTPKTKPRSFVEFSEMLREETSEENSRRRLAHGLPDLNFFAKKKADISIDYSQVESRTLRSLSKKPPIVTDLEGMPVEVTSFEVPLVPHAKIELGSRVNCLPTRYQGSLANPTVGSMYECRGVVIEIFSEDACSVRWDNGRINEYSITKDLVPIFDKPPKKITKLKTNDRVKLTVLTKYTPSYDNPVIGSRYECEGIIRYGGSHSSFCDVLWDNGKGNSYAASDLSLVDSELKSCKSIW